MDRDTSTPAGDASLLRKVELFAGVTDADIARVMDLCAVRNYARSAEILGDKDPTTDVFFVLDGTVRVTSVAPTGREVIFNDVPAGNIIGEFAAIDGLPRSTAVVALTDCRLARMSSRAFVGLLEQDGRIAVRLLSVLVGKIRKMTERVFEVSALAVRERVRRELLRLATDGEPDGEALVIRPAPTHYEIAARIGSHREAVTREFNRLEAAGIVEVKRRQMRILDIQRLKAMEED